MFQKIKDFLAKLTGPAQPPAPPPPVDPNAPPAPVPPTPPTNWVNFALKLLSYLALAAWVVKGVLWISGNGPAPGPMPDLPQQVAPADPDAKATGWINDPAAVERIVREMAVPSFGDTPAGRAVLGDEDVFLYRNVRKAAGLDDRHYPNVDQKQVGCCVGCGHKHGVDVLLANQIASGQAAEFKPVSVEVIYGGSRVEIGGGKIRGDGSVGAWAVKFISTYGVVPMETVGGVDLSTFDPNRARQYGANGVPKAVEAEARKYPVKGTAQVKNWGDVKKAIGQGYPVTICSNRGFTMTRDRDGFASPSGRWDHCMVCIGVRGGDRPGGFILNSWGDQAHTGGVYPADMPVAGFWADADVIDGMVKQGDSFALSDAVGFPARQLPWFTEARPARRLPFDADKPLLALAH
jgi:hypothetical protein